jgi:hypothetical protein
MAVSKYTAAKQETIIRWDEEDQVLDIYTASERVAVRLQRRGFPLKALANPDHGWRARGVPLNAITFRRQGPDCSGRPKGPAPINAFQVRPAAAARRDGSQIPAGMVLAGSEK